jgi:hypothetical protein
VLLERIVVVHPGRHADARRGAPEGPEVFWVRVAADGQLLVQVLPPRAATPFPRRPGRRRRRARPRRPCPPPPRSRALTCFTMHEAAAP